MLNARQSRREFLKRAGLLAGGLVVLGPSGLFRPSVSTAADQRSYAAGRFALELDGAMMGFVQSVEGGTARAEVIQEAQGPTAFTKKHIGQPKYEAITLLCGAGMGKSFYDWIKASWNMNYQRKNGAIITADYDLKQQARREFSNAVITEVGFPACDGAAKDPVYLTVKLAPEYTRMVKGSGAQVPVDPAAQQKLWLPSNFRLKILNLEQACNRVNKIEALTIKQKVVGGSIGDTRDYQKEPAKLEFPNLAITLPEADAGPFYAWYEDFVIKGNNADQMERPGVLELVSPDLKTVLFTLNFFNLGIFSFAPVKAEAGAEAIRRVKVEMYCERMDFQAGPVGAQAPGQGQIAPLMPPPGAPKMPSAPLPPR